MGLLRKDKPHSFKVVIAGGSVAGLAMANILEAYNIDYVLLEAYPHIAPQVGASIGLLPHGNRILDQLGLFKPILDMAPPIDSFTFRTRKGDVVATHKGICNTFVERHGYPIIFLDRQMVLQRLFDNIPDKSKILTEHRVKTVETNADGVNVTCTNGKTFSGDILVGADGIHSAVRSEMWRLAQEANSDVFPTDEGKRVPCDYGCIFGISGPCKGIEPGMLNSVFREKDSFLVNGGPEHRVYWFYFFKLPEKLYGTDIPRFSKDDEAKLLEKLRDENILPTLKFGKLVDKTITSNMTALPEYIYSRWYYERILTIGDASHKVHPIGGHGGNAAIESAATLANILLKRLDKSPSGKLATADVEDIFRQVQNIRRDRMQHLCEFSHDQQRTESLDNSFHKLKALTLLPLADAEDVTYNFSCNIPLAEKLDAIKVARKPKLIPFKNELNSAPTSRGAVGWALIAFYLTCGFLVHYGMWVWSSHYGLGSQFADILTTGIFPQDPTFHLKRTYTGIGWIDNYLTFLSAAYMTGLNNWDKNFGMLQMYFLGMLIQPIAVWTIEACRKRHAMTPMAMIIVWFTFVQWAGIGIYMPIYYAVFTVFSDKEPYWWPLNREVPIASAQALLPANIVGYVIPTILMFVPWKNAELTQIFEALWQPSPMFVPLLTILFALIWSRRNPDQLDAGPKKATKPYADVPLLKRIYLITGAMGFALHLYVVCKLLASSDPTFNLRTVFVPDFSPQPKALGEGLRALFMADFWGFYIASYVWCCAAVWDLKRVGRTTVDVGKSSAAILLANVVLGPGCAMSAVWYWREDAMAKTTFDDIEVQS